MSDYLEMPKAPEPEPEAEEAPFVASTRSEGSRPVRALALAEIVPTDERELQLEMKHWRGGRATRSIGEAISRAYIAIFAIVVLGAMVANVIAQAQVSVSTCNDPSCLSARTVLPWAAIALVVAVALAVSRLFGPVLASAAEGFWLMDAPVRRGRLLGRRLFAVVAVASLVAAVLGGLVATLSGSAPLAILAWTVASGLASGAAVSFAAAQQSRADSRVVRVLGLLFALAALVAMVLVVAIAVGWVQPQLIGDRSLLIAGVIGALGLVIGVLALVSARLRLDQLQRTRLTSGGSLVSGLSGAMFALDLGLMNDILTERRCEEIGNVRVRKGHFAGLGAIVMRDLQRLLRFPRPLLAIVVVAVVPYVLDALGLAVIAPVIGAIALFAAVVPLLGGLRVFTRSGGMARALPYNPGQIKRASVIVPAIICILWAALTFPAFAGFGSGALHRSIPEAMVYAEIVAAAGLLAAIRWTTAKPINFSAPMVATQAGAMPPGMVTNLFRGFDLCLLITAPLVFNLPWLISVALIVICAFVLLGSFNLAEMQYKAKQQQAEMDRLKAGRGGRIV